MKFKNQVEREFWQAVFQRSLVFMERAEDAAGFADRSVEELRERWYPISKSELRHLGVTMAEGQDPQAVQSLIDPERQAE